VAGCGSCVTSRGENHITRGGITSQSGHTILVLFSRFEQEGSLRSPRLVIRLFAVAAVVTAPDFSCRCNFNEVVG